MRVIDKLVPSYGLVVFAALVGASVAMLAGSVPSGTGPSERASTPPRVTPTLPGVAALSQSLRLTPVLDGDRVTGFAIAGVREGSLWQRMGLNDGDQIQDLYEFSSFHRTDHLEHHELIVNFVRAGEPLRVEYAMPPTASEPTL